MVVLYLVRSVLECSFSNYAVLLFVVSYCFVLVCFAFLREQERDREERQQRKFTGRNTLDTAHGTRNKEHRTRSTARSDSRHSTAKHGTQDTGHNMAKTKDERRKTQDTGHNTTGHGTHETGH